MHGRVLWWIVAVLATPVALLVIHVFRDVRGGRRNRGLCCYACGEGGRSLVPVYHHRGGTFQYCKSCRDRHGALEVLFVGLALVVAVGVAVLTFLAGRWS